MKRSWRLFALLSLVLLTACNREVDNTEPPAELTSIEQAIPLILEWKLDTRAAGNRAAYRLRPLMAGDFMYSIDTSGTISYIDPKIGRRLWYFETGLSAITGLGGNPNLIIATSQDGHIQAYIPAESTNLQLLWETQIDSEIRSTPIVDLDQVFVRSVDGKLRSMAASDGSQQWMVSRRVPPLSLTGTSQPVVLNDRVISGFDDGKLAAFDRATGQVIWESTVSYPSGRTEVERLVDVDAQFVLRDGVIYAVSFQGRLVAIQAVSGDLLWTREFSSFQSIEIDNSAIYLSSDDSHLWSIDRRTGTAFWKQDVLHARRITAPTVIGENLVVADLEGYLHWFRKSDGKLIGRIRPTSERNFVQPLNWRGSILTLDKVGFLASVTPQQ